MRSSSTIKLSFLISATVTAVPIGLLLADEVERVPHRDTTLPARATAQDRARGFQLFSRHWMDAVFETTVPARRAPLVSLETFASPGEYEPVAFGLHALVDLTEVRLTASEPVSKGGHRLAAPEVRVARNLLMRFGEDQALAIPIVLEKRVSYKVPSGSSRFCWVTVHVPHGTPAGTYRSHITIAEVGEPTAIVPFNVEVLPIELLSAGDLDQWYGFWIWHLTNPPPYAPDPLDAFKDMIEHGMNTVHFDAEERFPFVKSAGGYECALDGSIWEQFLDDATEAGFRKPLMIRVDAIAAAAGDIFPYSTYLEEERYNRVKANPDFERLFCKGVAKVIAECKQRGLPEPVFGIGDEMQMYERETHGYLDRLIHRAGAISFANGIGPHPAGSTDWRAEAIRMTEILMPGFALTDYHGRLLQGYPEAVELAKVQGKRMMTYNFALPNEPGQARWRFGTGFFFESLGKGCEGQSIHAYYYTVGDPYNLLDGPYAERTYQFPPMTGVGPRVDANWKLPIPLRNEVGGPTINYESIREGIDDMRYITTLKQLIAKARNADRITEAEAAQDVLNAIVGSLEFSAFYAMAAGWKELTPGSVWQRVSPPFDPIASGKAEKRYPSPVKFVDGVKRYPCGWRNVDYDDARWGVAQEILQLQRALN